MTARESAEMKLARELVTGERKENAYGAAKETGLAVRSISRTKWYKDHIAANPQQQYQRKKPNKGE